MSFLRCARLPRLRPGSAHRPLGAAFISSTSRLSAATDTTLGPSNEVAESDKQTQDFLDMLSAGSPADAVEADDLTPPPTAPPTAYPPPSPPVVNPMKAEPSPVSIETSRRSSPVYSLHVRATKRNTITTLARPDGGAIGTWTGGSVGFKHGNRSSYEAAFQCVMRAFGKISEYLKETGGKMSVHLYLNGFGQGRDAVYRALTAQEGEKVRGLIMAITDKTPIKIGGTRAMKMRRR